MDELLPFRLASCFSFIKEHLKEPFGSQEVSQIQAIKYQDLQVVVMQSLRCHNSSMPP